jgi:DNA-binding NtrC family response regulator
LADGAYTEAIERYEHRLIDAGLARCGGRNKIAARLPGIACTALRNRIEKYGLSAVA